MVHVRPGVKWLFPVYQSGQWLAFELRHLKDPEFKKRLYLH